MRALKNRYFSTSLFLLTIAAPADNLQEILSNIVKKDGISKEKKLGYFNAFVRFSHRYGAKLSSNYSHDEILCW